MLPENTRAPPCPLQRQKSALVPANMIGLHGHISITAESEEFARGSPTDFEKDGWANSLQQALSHFPNSYGPNLDSILKSRDITLPTKVHLVKAIVFPVVMYGCESWTIKKAERQRIDAFELWC